MNPLGNKELSGRVIAAAIEVHKAFGPGFIESVYENALCFELTARGIRFERQKTVKLYYRQHEVGEHRLDLLVEDCLLVENKAVSALENIFFAIGRSYLKAAGLEDGLLFNFASMPLTVRRIGREWPQRGGATTKRGRSFFLTQSPLRPPRQRWRIHDPCVPFPLCNCLNAKTFAPVATFA